MSWEDSILRNVKIDKINLKQGWTFLLKKITCSRQTIFMILFKALVKHSLLSAQPCRCHCFFDLLLSLLSLLLGDVIEI